MKKLKWHKAREEYPNDYQEIVCINYYKRRIHNRWGMIIGVFYPSETYKHEEHKELWEWARVETGFDDWSRYADVKYWCPYDEFLEYIKKTTLYDRHRGF